MRAFLSLILALAAVVAYASDPVGVYARVDRVVLEPNAEHPERIQVWGVFAIAVKTNPNDYQPPVRGYLYYSLPSNASPALNEWADLERVAGTKQIVAFGSRYGSPRSDVRVRNADERPDAPDTYSVNVGVTKVNGRTDYAPVRSLIEFTP